MSVVNAYANALLGAARENKKTTQELDLLEKQMNDFSQVLESSKEARVALFGPLVSPKEKILLTQALCKKLGLDGVIVNFLMLMSRKGRMSLLNEVARAFHDARWMGDGGVTAEVTSAEELSQQEISEITQAFSKKMGKPVALRVKKDPLLIAGVKVTAGGITYDGSLRAQLQRLGSKLTQGIAGE